MVGLLELAHDRGCEVDLAAELEQVLAAGALPDLAQLARQFAATAIPVPDVTVLLPPVASYDALLTMHAPITSQDAGQDMDQATSHGAAA